VWFDSNVPSTLEARRRLSSKRKRINPSSILMPCITPMAKMAHLRGSLLSSPLAIVCIHPWSTAVDKEVAYHFDENYTICWQVSFFSFMCGHLVLNVLMEGKNRTHLTPQVLLCLYIFEQQNWLESWARLRRSQRHPALPVYKRVGRLATLKTFIANAPSTR
jgi:hypothetical protein